MAPLNSRWAVTLYFLALAPLDVFTPRIERRSRGSGSRAPGMDTGDLLSFGPYVLDPSARCLTRDGVDVRIASRHFDLLCVLASHATDALGRTVH